MKILNKNGLPYSIRVLFAPGVVILPIELDLRDFFEFRFSLHEERTRPNTSVRTACRTKSKIPGCNVPTATNPPQNSRAKVELSFQSSNHTIAALRATPGDFVSPVKR